MRRWIPWLVAIPALAVSSALAQQAPPRALAHDPFERRAVQQLMNTIEAPPAASTPAPEPVPASAPATLKDLRAVMAGGARPLVNLGGTILGIGDSVEGFSLVEVREHGAVFARDGRRIELVLGRKQAP